MEKKVNGSCISELEVSITSQCQLSCFNCGFNIPNQPYPSNSKDTIQELYDGLQYLKNLKIQINTLIILGGEPSFNSELLLTAIRKFQKLSNINSIEIVTHGLTPQNIKSEVFDNIDKLTISVYFNDNKLILLWKKLIKKYYPNLILIFRMDKQWDKWIDDKVISDDEAQILFNNCWYKKHCTTLERNRLFICSRIAKMSLDNDGLLLSSITSICNIEDYLNKNEFIEACKNCTPMMKIEKIEAGQQPDNRIIRMVPKAVAFLENKLNDY